MRSDLPLADTKSYSPITMSFVTGKSRQYSKSHPQRSSDSDNRISARIRDLPDVPRFVGPKPGGTASPGVRLGIVDQDDEATGRTR